MLQIFACIIMQGLVSHHLAEEQGIRLHTRGAVAVGLTVPMSACQSATDGTLAAGTRGLLGVAALEFGALLWSGIDSSPLAAINDQMGNGAEISTDAFGATACARIWLIPQLHSVWSPTISAVPLPAFSGGSLPVTGGLGDLGQLVGMWATQVSLCGVGLGA
jgi:hypothetical protein